MELTGAVVIEATRDQVWDALNDADVLQACIPGCEEVINESPTVRRARVMVKLGPVRARFSGTLTLSEVVIPERCLMQFEGSGGAAGMASGRSQVELFDENGRTRVTYTVQASVGGKLGQIGGRLLDASARQLADQFFAALRERLAKSVGTQIGEQCSDETSAIASGALADQTTPESVLAAQSSVIPAAHLASSESGVTVGVASTTAPQAPQAPQPVSSGHGPSARPNLLEAEFSRLLWFLVGVATTGFGVWLGALLF
jgi:hypothetical protein